MWLSSVGLPIYICQHNCSLTDFIELILLWIFQNKRWKKVKKKTRLCKLTLRGGKMKKKEEINIVFVRQKKKSSSFQYLGSMQLRISSSLTVVHPIIHIFLLSFWIWTLTSWFLNSDKTVSELNFFFLFSLQNKLADSLLSFLSKINGTEGKSWEREKLKHLSFVYRKVFKNQRLLTYLLWGSEIY